ncbi:MAG: DUF2853 family protein [Pseudomonadota bacterium]
MADHDYVADVKRYDPNADEAKVQAIVKHLGIALKSRDASLVSCSSKDELARVRDSWCKKKLNCSEDDAALDAAINSVCEQMKADSRKHRVPFYYLLAQKLDKMAAI